MTMTTIRGKLGRLRAALAREDGYASDAMLFPAVLVLVLILIQFALYYLGEQIAQGTAVVAYQQARSYQATDSDGVAAGESFSAANEPLLQETNITIVRGATTVAVTVTGRPLTIFGLPLPQISRTETGPIERWVQ